MSCEWGVHVGVRTDNTDRILFLSTHTDLYRVSIKSPDRIKNQTVPFIQSYSILKFDYKYTWAVIGCIKPDGERDRMRLNYAEWRLKINLNVRH